VKLIDVILKGMNRVSYLIFVFLSIWRSSFDSGAMAQGLMDTPLAPLPKCFGATIYTALERFLARMCKVMFNKVLLQSKLLATLVAYPFLVDFVNLHVALKTVLGLEVAIAVDNIAFEPLLSWGICCHFVIRKSNIKMVNIYDLYQPID
jgi:hypothetical protein